MPPFLKVQKDEEVTLSNDTNIHGYMSHPIVFTDTSYDVPHKVKTVLPSYNFLIADTDVRLRTLKTIGFPSFSLHAHRNWQMSSSEARGLN